MRLTQIVGLVNTKLAGETLTYNQAQPYLDACVCDINTHLNACFPMFSELHPILTQDASYNEIPDTYIVSVIVPGVAFKFYTTDEEGISTAQGYQQEYERGLFYMTRDYSASIPEKYRAENRGYIEGPAPSGVNLFNGCGVKAPLNPDIRYVEGPQGIPGPKGDKGDKGDKGEKGDKGLGVDSFYSEFIEDVLLLQGVFVTEVINDVLCVRRGYGL